MILKFKCVQNIWKRLIRHHKGKCDKGNKKKTSKKAENFRKHQKANPKKIKRQGSEKN